MLCITICNIFIGEESTSRSYLRAGDYLSSQPEDRKAYNSYATAYEIAALAATYVQSQASRLINLDSKLRPEEDDDVILDKTYSSQRVYNSEMVVYMAATTITAVVAAPEKEKQEAAKDLQSLHSSPCEWFICDDSSIYTRCFVIQGSASVASWQENLFFEPTKFEC
ncbi:putative phospholipase A1 PLIP1/2/3 [Helianthus annuus]|nr:putative phospholipase A1 PLIP1/2/3 [Helianthus annuus]